MHKRIVTSVLMLGLGLSVLPSTGCFYATGPSLGLLSVPVPVTPYMQKTREDQHEIDLRYSKVPILGPITPGAPTAAMDPPSDHEVMAALERARPLQGGVPFLNEVQRSNVRIVKEKIADYIDEPRVLPLIGPVQLHHVHYKCTVYFSERKIVGFPIPHTLQDDEAVEVLYLDHNHLHQVGDVNYGPTSNY
ncbi:MAG: hypothetical protein Q8M16_22990 [Pirellulaceae bacterium]|nr:hypothetical protein [Pirellulaceae bacterium]